MSLTLPKPRRKAPPPPRPPPPNFAKLKSKSSLNLIDAPLRENSTDWSLPNSPKINNQNYGGSVSSSYNSSTSSLVSSKKSLEQDLATSPDAAWPLPEEEAATAFHSFIFSPKCKNKNNNNQKVSQNVVVAPTIIRAKGGTTNKPQIQPKPTTTTTTSQKFEQDSSDSFNTNVLSLPMPVIPPPPSPPKELAEIDTPYALALFDYSARHTDELSFKVDDVILLIRRINSEWLYGRNSEDEGIFPENFVDIQVPLKGEEMFVTALYDFVGQMPGDLNLKAGQKITVLKRISQEWLYGESNNKTGEFPVNFINRVPEKI